MRSVGAAVAKSADEHYVSIVSIPSSIVLKTEIECRRPAIRNGTLRVRKNGSNWIDLPNDPIESNKLLPLLPLLTWLTLTFLLLSGKLAIENI